MAARAPAPLPNFRLLPTTHLYPIPPHTVPRRLLPTFFLLLEHTMCAWLRTYMPTRNTIPGSADIPTIPYAGQTYTHRLPFGALCPHPTYLPQTVLLYLPDIRILLHSNAPSSLVGQKGLFSERTPAGLLRVLFLSLPYLLYSLHSNKVVFMDMVCLPTQHSVCFMELNVVAVFFWFEQTVLDLAFSPYPQLLCWLCFSGDRQNFQEGRKTSFFTCILRFQLHSTSPIHC